VPLITAGWKLWPLVGIVTYTLIPSEHRVLWIDAIEVFYSAILSTVANNPVPTEDVSKGKGAPVQTGRRARGRILRRAQAKA